MKNFNLQKLSLLCMCSFLLTSCDSDDDLNPDFQGDTTTYELQPVADAAVDGTVSFTENENGSTTVEIVLEGAEEGETYSPRLLHGNAAEGGELALSLEELEEGKSTTTFSTLDDESTVSYEDLIDMDGHIAIYLVEEETETLVATADIGANELTGESETYETEAVGDTGIAASVIFEERKNGATLVTITSEDTEEGSAHPAAIHAGAAGEQQGDKIITLNSLEGGRSITNLAAFDEVEGEAEAVSYEDLLELDASLNILLSEEEEVIISQGNIGANAGE